MAFQFSVRLVRGGEEKTCAVNTSSMFSAVCIAEAVFGGWRAVGVEEVGAGENPGGDGA